MSKKKKITKHAPKTLAASAKIVNKKTDKAAGKDQREKGTQAKQKDGRRFFRILKFVGICLLVLIVLLAGFLYWFVTKPWPKTNGTLSVNGLQATVTVVRDSLGIPNIYAQNEHDLFFAQGYITAQDRLFQMETHRRVGNGSLSEVVGAQGLSADMTSRVYGLRRIAELSYPNLDDESKAVLDAYCEGINAFIDENINALPLEFTLVGFKPDYWVPLDVMAFSNFLAQINALNIDYELLYVQAYAKLGETMTADMLPPWDTDNPEIITKELEPYSWRQYLSPKTQQTDLTVALRENFESGQNGWLKNVDLSTLENDDLFFAASRQFKWASGTWAVSGDHTASGKAILTCDVHMSLAIPSYWYEIGLHGGRYDVSGFSLPGAPYVMLGRNKDISWAFVNFNADVTDLYKETFDDPKNPTKYLYQGQWYDLEKKSEVIKIKGQDPYVLDLLFTRHGPIVNEGFNLKITEEEQRVGANTASKWEGTESNTMRWEGSEPLAMRWAVQDGCYIIVSISELNRAGNWQEFRSALSKWDSLGESFIYADNQGNIGYQAAVKAPIRADGHLGIMPVSGSDGEYEWQGYVPFEELPSLYNPPTGYVAAVNNKPTTDDYPYFWGYDWWHPGYRARTVVTQLDAMIASGRKITVEDMIALQGDTYSYAADQINQYVKNVIPDNDLQAKSLEYVKSWNGRFDLDSVGAAIYAAWFDFMFVNTYYDERTAYGVWGYWNPLKRIQSMVKIVKDPDNKWFDDVYTENIVETRDDIIKLSFTQAVEYLSGNWGKDPSKWQLKKVQTSTLQHQLFQGVKYVGDLFQSKTVPFAGSPTSVTFAYSSKHAPEKMNIMFGSVQKHLVSFDDPDNMLAVISSGQSGHLFHPNRQDQIDKWAKVEFFTMPFSKNAVDQAAKHILILEPAR